uniref:SCP domain-containing protein n=1 Tax=Glossina austeni TaxID=7395 RepID=A0A1A9VV03_GLOAU
MFGKSIVHLVHLAKTGTLEIDPSDKYGQALFMGANYDPSAEEVIKDWYEEIDHFDFNNPKFSQETGNFTQLMWKGSKELGVGIEKAGRGGTIVVCSYHPHGNRKGEFEENVPPLKTKLEYGIKTPSETSIEEEVLAKEEKPAEPPAAKPADAFEDECLKSHNKYRDMHGCPPLVLNKELNTYSTEWAEHLVRTDKFEHRTDNRYGENLYCTSGSSTPKAEDAVKSWYDEISKYNYKNAGFHANTGHFTQVVWKKSKQLGVGRATKDRTTIVVCNYEPQGNVVDHFPENVPQVGGQVLKEERPLRKSEDVVREESEFEEQCLKAHNKYRALHGAPPLKLNKELTALAADWATTGFRMSLSVPTSLRQNAKFEKDRHQDHRLTSIRSKQLQHLFKKLEGNSTYVVCFYDPAGNNPNQFPDNVLPPIP